MNTENVGSLSYLSYTILFKKVSSLDARWLNIQRISVLKVGLVKC
jgi:hypothetical protein